ncbi:ATP-binding protein [Bizionia argentinensis JUB59]|uniref:ATP-binding protein n=1 Tax=Bizionia argentinensis JUB59 TaxID=1046627 RepID=G2EDQ3_9FLAO|nr:ATP-binding protein [Bizionia argentinensis]EGV43433.1 ATP-binding protein [Bizionia argentinensis JUB59]
MKELNNVNIRPGVTILSVLKHLNYKPYYALAEFIDNAIDSFLKNEEELRKIEGKDFKLRVDIEFDTNNKRITIKDNAAGIQSKDYQRAFRTAELPPDNTRLSEFGMGMKSAACWFSNNWQAKTTALNETVERKVNFDISKIVEDKIQELQIETKEANSNSHYTLITLFGIEEKMPIRRGLGKVKRHLASIYRDFFKREILDLYINGEKLEYKIPKILNTAYFETPNAENINWKQEVEFDFGNDHNGSKLRAKGFIAIMETMSVRDSGFALFRRGRVIEGSADNDEGFRPPALSGSLGSHRYKRLFGELHLEGFNVSHTKDGFQWDDNMEAFLDLLKGELEGENSIPILKQADKYRVRESAKNYEKVSQKVVDNTTDKIQDNIAKDVQAVVSKPTSNIVEEPSLEEVVKSYHKKFPLNISNIDYMVHIELSYDETIDELIQVGDHLILEKDTNYKNIGVRLSLIHPFMVEFAGDDHKVIEPVLRLVVALGLSEIIVKKSGAPVTELRNNMNDLLLGSLSKL